MRPTESPPHAEAGFTLIEVLVAVSLFAVLITVILGPLTGIFGLTNQTTQQASATTLAQTTVEQIRGQWQDQSKYNQTCINWTLPTGVSVAAVQNLDFAGNVTGTSTLSVSTSCVSSGASSSGPPLRRVTVTATSQKISSSLVVEINQP